MKDYFNGQSKNYLSVEKDKNDKPADMAQESIEALVIGEAFGVIKEGINCLTEYAKCREHEITERRRISAQLRAVNNLIAANKEIYLKTIEEQFKERRERYEIADEVIKKALEYKDKEMIRDAYNFILNIYHGAPDATEFANNLLGNQKMINYLK